MNLHDALTLFRRLGIDVTALSSRDFRIAYVDLARRYHPDVSNQKTHDLMANINAARTMLLTVYRKN